MSVLFPDAIERPTSKTPAVREKALKQLLPAVLRWLRQGGDTEDDEEGVLRDLDNVLDGFNDAYQSARDLESRYGWSPDAELVEILDGFNDYAARDEAVRAWVREVQPKPTFKLGDRVIWKRKYCPSVEGEITKIYEESAQYIVSKDDEAKGCGTYVNWEDAEAVQ